MNMCTSIFSVSSNRYKVIGIKCLLCEPRPKSTFSSISAKFHQFENKSSLSQTYSKLATAYRCQRILQINGSSTKVLHHRNIFTLLEQNVSSHQCRISTKQHQSLVSFQPSASVHSDSAGLDDQQPPSWLFVSPAVAGAYGAQVNVELDLEERLNDEEALQILRENVKCRGLSLDIGDLLSNFKLLTQMKQEKDTLKSQKEDILQQFKALREASSDEDHTETKNHLGEKLRSVKENIAALKSSWDLEEKVMLDALNLPNDVHPTTPLHESLLMREETSQTEHLSSLNHVQIANKFNLIKFSNVGPKAYYFKKDLVLAEMALTSLVCSYLQTQGYRHMNGPEFVKTPIVEGCGGDVRDGYKVLTMVDPHKTAVEPMNHLSGVSLHMFAAYVARTCIGDSALPLQRFACGRRYQNCDLPGLFGATQSTQATIFSCIREEDVDKQFESILELIWEFLHKFGFTIRQRQICVKDLQREEMRRMDIEMFSTSLQRFIPVASVSDVGDFISRRLMVTHNQNHADIRTAKRVHMIHGTVLNITSFLALWMEHSFTNESQFTLKSLPPLQHHKDVTSDFPS